MKYFRLTTPQQNIWNLQKYYPDTAISNLCGAVFYQEKRDSEKLRQAVCQFIRSQSGIRLRFCEADKPMQYVSGEVDEDIPVFHFQSREEMDQYAEVFAREPIGLLDRQMYKFVVFHLEKENRSGLLVVLSHLISDAWTFGLMANQIELAYHRLAGETEYSSLEGDYTDFIESEEQYFKSERYGKDQRYWEEKYTVRPEESPIKMRSAAIDNIGAERITKTLPLSLEQKIAAYCRKYSVTLAVLFETALVVYLSHINPDIQSVTVGVPVLNRSGAREKAIAGMFVSTMPLTVAVEENMEILELTGRITKGHMDLFRHQKYPYADILRSLREKQDFSGNLYDVMISCQNAKTKAEAETKWYSNGCSEVTLVIHIDNRDGNDCHTVNVDYQTAVFGDGAEVEWLTERLEYILGQIVEERVKLVGDISIVPPKEYDRVVYEFNDTYVKYPREKCVHELFMEQAAKTPERTALVFEDKKFTYRQLDEMSNSLALFLRKKGVQCGDRVAVLLKRDERVIMAQLAVLKLGAVFIPIDSRYPQDRVEYILTESDARILLKNRENSMCFSVECCVEEWNYLLVEKFKPIHVSPDEACYAIFTSGSTGKPKGCLLTQNGIVNFCVNLNIKKYCDQLKDKICISVNTISFDMFILETLVPLTNGYTVVLANEEQSINREEFKKLLRESHANIIQTTPTRYKIYFDQSKDNTYAKQFDIIASSGEPLPLELLRSFIENTDAKIFNPMGPSECTIYVVGGEMSSVKKTVSQTDITLGKPIANTQIHILDKENKPLPVGVAGELCVTGDGVGKGYMNRPELTAEKFVLNPFANAENHHGKIMYRAGDLARWRWDGEIEYLGRIDTQVKIRGLRIELGEIECVMADFLKEGLSAVAEKRDKNSRQYLVGYYNANREIDEKELRRHLSAKLPKYMVPNYFMRLETIPMTASGKIDRKNLPVPHFTALSEEYTAPVTDTEKRLAQIWQNLLSVEKAGRTDDFFELGGDSLLAISMLSEIEKIFHVEVSVKEVMEHSELAALAHCLEEAGRAACPNEENGGMEEGAAAGRITARYADRYPLLPQQKAVYAACMKEPGTLVYNMPARIVLPDAVDRNRLKESIARVMDRHRLLKSCIRMEEAGLYGVYDGNASIVFEEYETGKEDAFVRPFDLGKAPLVRVGFTENTLLFDMHHIIADGTSMNILLREITAVYGGSMLQEQGAEYPDYAEYFYSMDTEVHKAYFREMLKCDWEPVMLPETKKPGTGGQSRMYKIPEAVFAGARKYARENGLTDTMVFLGAYGILLSKYTGRKEILSSIILQNRTHADTRGMVGMFVNTLPICLALGNSGGDGTAKTIAEYMREVKEKLLGLFRYQELPFEDISEAVGMNDRSVVNTSFVYQGDGEKALYLDGEKLTPQFIDTHTAKFDLSMELTPIGDCCRMRLEYNLEKYDGQLMDELAEAYVRILRQLDREQPAEISVLSEAEYHKIIEEFNDTYVNYPREKCVHELFMEQAAKTPERTALVFEDKKFTYRQLDEMSNSLAHFLRGKGVKPGDVVPIIAKRSWHVIVAMLGVLKAGGAYMPVDPGYPTDRVRYMLTETQTKLVLAYGWLSHDIYEAVDLAGVDYGEHKAQVENLNSSDDICYVLYTSGSTGRPKAVCISHANMGNYNNNNKNHYQYEMLGTCSTVLADTEFVFDISAFEIFLSLLNGLCIVLSKEIMDAQYLAGLIEEYHVDALHITPTKLLTLLHDQSFQKAAAQIKVLMVGAEAFTENLYQTVSRYTDAVVYNGYGPTETTIGCSFKKINGRRRKCVHELFAEQAAKTPEEIALVFEDKGFTYRQLDEMSNSLGHFLREKGVKRGDVVPIIAKRSWYVIAAMLGVLKAGGAYMLVDYQYPAERISYLVQECKADITFAYGCGYAGAVQLEDMDLSKDTDPIESVNGIGDILCVIHTSGSTGVPKVTALSHENIAHYIDYAEKLFRGTSQTIATTTITFDAFIQETLVSLCRQIPVILLSERQTASQSEFEKAVCRYKKSFLFQTPTKLQNYIRNSKTKEFLSGIASFVIGGEVFPQELYDAIRTHHPEGRIYNIYGPTETTVCAVVNELAEDADITIGTPIANTQIYILDRDQQPLPIGVPGELCIAGEGVGKGYLNRPELTAEKFVPNPFATAENHHGKVMYRTGDLARFRSDGEIEYLGRMDTQVKIRGLRIELGEIESVMGSFPGIGLCAVTDKRDETGRQYLVGYYTLAADCTRAESNKGNRNSGRTEEEQDVGKAGFAVEKEQSAGKYEMEAGTKKNTDFTLDEKALRAHLSAKLPKYMVPNYFMRLETMPMTASGKTDRKNLPVPDFTQTAREYVPPVTETEKELCRLMEELLHMEQVGVTDDFFELGGDSLTAIEFLAKAHDSGIAFALQNIFDYPTVQQLCSHMEAGDEAKIHYEPADFDRYRDLLAENVIDEAFVPERKFLGNVLLTGATGFLGAHVLDRLLQEETGKVYCLVRDGEKVSGSERLREILRYYFGERYEGEFTLDSESRRHPAGRIIPISGDIEQDGLAENMPVDVKTVIHTAASVKHYGSYEYFNRVNVEGTRHVVNYAKSAGARLIHISTLSVSGNSLADEFAVYRSEEEKHFGETSLYIGQPLDNVYIHSKFEAEKVVLDTMLEGLDAKIIRVGNLTSRASDYKFQPNYQQNAFLTRFKAILEFGLFPDYLMDLYSEFSPIDLTAEGVVKIAQYAGRQTVFHLNSNRPIYFDRFLEVVQELGIPMKVVDGDSFTQALRRTIRDRVTEYIFEAFQNDMDDRGRLVYDSNIRIDNDFTVWFLKKLGFEWNEIDLEYIQGYVEYFREIGYLHI